MSSSESDAFAPKREVNCASPIEGKINSYAVNNYNVESDPFAEDCTPVSGDEVDEKLDLIFSSKNYYMEKTITGPSTTMSRRARKQKQKETQARLAQQREDERLRKLELIQKQGGEQPVKSTKHGQRKVDLVRQKMTNTTKKSIDQLQPVVQPPVYNDRRLYNEESFQGDLVVPVKIIEKEVQEDTGDFKVNYHFMMRNKTDGSAFTYGKTLIKKYSDVERKEQAKVSKTRDKYNKRFISSANFAYDLQGNQIPILKNKNMDPIERHGNDDSSVLQQKESINSNESIALSSEEEFCAAIAANKQRVEAQRAQFAKSFCKQTLTSSQVEEYTGSYDPRDGFETIDKEIEQNMESIKKEEEISQPSVRQGDETLAAIAALSAQVAELTKVITEQSKELALLRNELAEKDREIKALKEKPIQQLPAEESLEKSKKEDQPTTSKPLAKKEEEKVNTSKPPNQKGKALAKEDKKSKPQMPPRAKTMPVSKFEDDGIDKLVNMDKAETPAQKVEVIKNTMTMPEEQRVKAINQEMRSVNSEKVGEKSFSEKLAAGLVRSKSSIRWTPKAEQKPSVPRPKGIQEKAWRNILKQTPETLENWEAKRKVKIFEQYKRLFYAQHVKLELLWQAAAVKAKTPKVKNDWLIAPGKVVALLRKEKLEDVLKSIQEWRNKAATYIPKESKIATDWAKVPLPTEE